MEALKHSVDFDRCSLMYLVCLKNKIVSPILNGVGIKKALKMVKANHKTRLSTKLTFSKTSTSEEIFNYADVE